MIDCAWWKWLRSILFLYTVTWGIWGIDRIRSAVGSWLTKFQELSSVPRRVLVYFHCNILAPPHIENTRLRTLLTFGCAQCSRESSARLTNQNRSLEGVSGSDTQLLAVIESELRGLPWLPSYATLDTFRTDKSSAQPRSLVWSQRDEVI